MNGRLRADARLLPLLGLAVIAAGFIAQHNATVAQAGTFAAIYAVAAIGLSVLLGNVRQISVGQASFFGIGAYTVAYLTTTSRLPFWPAAVVGIAAATIVGLALGVVALRFRGHYLAMATLAFGLIVPGVFHASRTFGGAVGISDVPYARLGGVTLAGPAAFAFAWTVVALVALVTLNLLRRRTGVTFEAIRNDELAAEAIGIPTRRCKIVAFAYAGTLAGAAGAIYAAFLGLVVPDAIGIALSIDLLLMVVIGGSGSISGAIAGAALIGFLDVAGHEYENWREVVYGAIVILVVVAAPQGLFGLVRGIAGRPSNAHHPKPLPASPPCARRECASTSAAPLAVEHVTKRFGGLVAVDDVSFALARGTVTALIGPNGAGKTTLFNAVCGIGRLDGGTVRIAGTDVAGWQPHRVAALGVGRTFQNARLFAEMTVLENVVAAASAGGQTSFAADLFGLPVAGRASRDALERARDALARLGLEAIAAVRARSLAFGERRRVELARAIVTDPWLLLVDEPAAGLNAAEHYALERDLTALRDAGTTLLLVEHDMKLVMSLSDRVMVLEFGRLIADGAPSAVRRDPAVAAAYLGTAG